MRVAFIGAGAMGRAISVGAYAADPAAWSFVFFDPHATSAEQAASAVKGSVAATANDAIAGADIVVLAVKPQVQSRVIQGLRAGTACYISIAAGRSIADIDEDFRKGGNDGVPVVRVMPNVNALVGMATSAICDNGRATAKQLEEARSLFEAIGTTTDVAEDLFPAFTAMAGCSPAWYFRIVNSLALAGVKAGLPKAQAVEAAASAMAGSAATLIQALQSGGHAEVLVDQVCSPGGTTIAGLLAAEDAGLSRSLDAAVEAAITRDRELGKR